MRRIEHEHPHTGTIADHHPLRLDEIETLLHEAKEYAYRGSTQMVASIQVRLNQGLPGCTCPRQIDGPVAEAQNRMDELYVAFVQDPVYVDMSVLAKQLHDLMQ